MKVCIFQIAPKPTTKGCSFATRGLEILLLTQVWLSHVCCRYIRFKNLHMKSEYRFSKGVENAHFAK